MIDIDAKVAAQFTASLASVLDLLADAIVARIKDQEFGPRWMNEKQAAEHCATTRRVIADGRRRGEFPIRRRGRSYVYDAKDLDAWLAPATPARRVQADAPEMTSREKLWAWMAEQERIRSSPKHIAMLKRQAESRAKARKCAGTRVNGQLCKQIVKGDNVFCRYCKGAAGS